MSLISILIHNSNKQFGDNEIEIIVNLLKNVWQRIEYWCTFNDHGPDLIHDHGTVKNRNYLCSSMCIRDSFHSLYPLNDIISTQIYLRGFIPETVSPLVTARWLDGRLWMGILHSGFLINSYIRLIRMPNSFVKVDSRRDKIRYREQNTWNWFYLLSKIHGVIIELWLLCVLKYVRRISAPTIIICLYD